MTTRFHFPKSDLAGAFVLLILVLPGSLKAQIKTAQPGKLGVEQTADRLIFSDNGQSIGEFVFRDEAIRRPYFANLRAPDGLQVTRSHPPVKSLDATDHDTMHPGIWLGFGDISGNDFWRNKAVIEHQRFTEGPVLKNNEIRFATESRLLTIDGQELCRMKSRFLLANRPSGRLLIWEATFHSEENDFAFGDQEEMGFGARVATALTEKNGGRILNSEGQESAAKTWGQEAAWCDYSGSSNGKKGGITLMVAPTNFRKSWWHNRDYGVFVANPFGRAAMKQGTKSEVLVRRGKSLRLGFAAVLHGAGDYQPEAGYELFQSEWKTWPAQQ